MGKEITYEEKMLLHIVCADDSQIVNLTCFENCTHRHDIQRRQSQSPNFIN